MEEGMSNTIWKTELEPTDLQTIDIPADAEILCAREQFDKICVWFRCNPANPLRPRRIIIAGTGHPDVGEGRYLGTAALHGGRIMFHVFEPL